MKVSLIVACGKNGQIGLDNKLLWHIPEDFKNFKKLTMGHTIIMGRNTFESLPNILPKRRHIVITSKGMLSDNPLLEFSSSLEDALELSKDEDEVWIIGGAHVYNEALEKKLVDRLCISEVNYDGKADTYLKKINFNEFELINEIKFNETLSEKGDIIPAWTFKEYIKIG